MLHVRRVGLVEYETALALQQLLWARHAESWLLLLEHPHVYTLGVRARPEHVLVDPATVGASMVRADRGGDVTYHGPGQLVGYPILDVTLGHGAIPAHVHAVEQIVIDALDELGVPGAGRRSGLPGVWLGERKVGAVGVRVTRGRSMHGFALNVCPNLAMFEHIVPCGIHGCAVTSLTKEGVDVGVDAVADVVARHAARRWARDGLDDRRISATMLAVELRRTSTFSTT
jgi:lipoic acid synthetase